MKTPARKTFFERLKTGLGEGIAHARRELTLKTIEVPEEPPESDWPTMAESGMSKTFGDLPQRYNCLINPYVNERLSRCPLCRKLTHGRKFALFIHVDQFGAMVLGKTCRYCTPCELIMIHQSELEAELAGNLSQLASNATVSPYLVMGTVDLKVWRAGLQGTPPIIKQNPIEHLTVFKNQFNLQVSGGGRSLDSDVQGNDTGGPGE